MRNLLLVSLLLLPSLSHAADGRIEINQARALAGGVTAADTPGFPVTLGAGGSYVPTSGLVVADPNLDAIEFTADGVTVDLNGFELQGPITCSGSGSTLTCGAGTGRGVDGQSRARETVMNGRVRGFGGGGVILGSSVQV